MGICEESGESSEGGEGAVAPSNPCLMVANGLFDRLRQDIFHIVDGDLYLARTRLSTAPENVEYPCKESHLESRVEILQQQYRHAMLTGYCLDALD